MFFDWPNQGADKVIKKTESEEFVGFNSSLEQTTTKGDGKLEKGQEFNKKQIDFSGALEHLKIHHEGVVAGSQFNSRIFDSPKKVEELLMKILPDTLNYDQYARAEITLDISHDIPESIGWAGVKDINEIKKDFPDAKLERQMRLPGGAEATEDDIEGAWYPEMERNQESGRFEIVLNEDKTVKNPKGKFEPRANIVTVNQDRFKEVAKTDKITVIIQKDKETLMPTVLTVFPGENAPMFPAKINTEAYKADSLTDSNEANYWENHAFIRVSSLSMEIEDKFNLLKNKVDNYEKQKEENLLNIEKNDLYKKILSEAGEVIIRPEDYNEKKELLAPNGQPSNLLEKEWKIARTPSFKKWFGNWEKNYNKEDLQNWVRYQYLKSLEENSLPGINRQIEQLEKNRTRFILKNDENNEHYKKSNDDFITSWRERKIEVLREISKIQAEIVNKNFNPHLSDYGKLIDENGEPLVLWRATNYGPNDKGYFEIPLMGKGIHPDGVKVGTFLGKKNEASFHHKGRLQEGKNSFLYSCFANVKNVDILSEKFYWGSEKERVEKIQMKHDGIIVKKDHGELFKDGRINLMDLIVFDSKNILILGLE